ncbi:MAG: hypothetical protein QNK35_07255, partial [Bacteroides sp.]|nr:hypothetical protein [Bacteroides sp.]
MKKITGSFKPLIFAFFLLLTASLEAKVKYDKDAPQLAFAAQEIEAAIKEAGLEDLKVSLLIKADESSPEAYQIRVLDVKRVEIIGTDQNGAMYGGLEVADRIRLGLPLEDQ